MGNAAAGSSDHPFHSAQARHVLDLGDSFSWVRLVESFVALLWQTPPICRS
jgi:hypothetical protein